MGLPVPPPARGSESSRDVVRPWALTQLTIPCWSHCWSCSVAVYMCQPQTHPWRVDEYSQETSPYECLVFQASLLHTPDPLLQRTVCVTTEWGGAALLLHSQPPSRELQSRLSCVFRGLGGDCAQTQPAAQGAMSSLWDIFTCQVWADCPWEDKHEGKERGIREEASHGENASLLLVREKNRLISFLCVFGSDPLSRILPSSQRAQDIQGGWVVSGAGVRGDSKIMAQKGAILLHSTWRLFLNRLPGNKHKHQRWETLLSLERKNWSSCSDFFFSPSGSEYFLMIIKGETMAHSWVGSALPCPSSKWALLPRTALTQGSADPGAMSFSPGDFQSNPEPGNWAAKSL